MSIVTSREELERAKGRGDENIIINGDLADKVKNAKKITILGAGTISVIAVAVSAATITAPLTGGMSYFAAAPVAALSGVEISSIIAVSCVGFALIIAVFKDYDEISYKKGELVLRRKAKKS